MTPQTIVSIYAVDEAGATGPPLGTGSLVHPQLVVVARPLRADLTPPGASSALRVGIAAVGLDEGFVDVIDVISVHVQEGEVEDQCQGDEWFRLCPGLLVGGHVE